MNLVKTKIADDKKNNDKSDQLREIPFSEGWNSEITKKDYKPVIDTLPPPAPKPPRQDDE